MNKKQQSFFVGVLVIILLVWGIVPWIGNTLKHNEVMKATYESENDSGALFYTDSPEAQESEYEMRKHQ